MLGRIGLEIAIAAATWAFSGFLWPLVKRQRLLKKVLRDQNFLQGLTRDVLSGPLPSGQLYSQEQGYASNLLFILESDKRTIRRLQLLFGVPLLALLAASYYLGPVYLLINLGISGLLASFPLGESGRASAITQVLTIAVLLYRWRAESREEADAFVKQAPSLRELYEAVVRVAMGTESGADASTSTEFQPPAAVGQYRLEGVTAQPAEAGGGFQARYRGPDSSYRDVFIYAVMPLGDQAAGETTSRAVHNEIMVLKAIFRSQQERGDVSDLRIDDEAEAEARVGSDSVAGYRLALSYRRRSTAAQECTYVHVFVYRGHFIKFRITRMPGVVTLKEVDGFAQAFLRELTLRPPGPVVGPQFNTELTVLRLALYQWLEYEFGSGNADRDAAGTMAALTVNYLTGEDIIGPGLSVEKRLLAEGIAPAIPEAAENVLRQDQELRMLLVYTWRMRLVLDGLTWGVEEAAKRPIHARLTPLLAKYGREFPEEVSPHFYSSLVESIRKWAQSPDFPPTKARTRAAATPNVGDVEGAINQLRNKFKDDPAWLDALNAVQKHEAVVERGDDDEMVALAGEHEKHGRPKAAYEIYAAVSPRRPFDSSLMHRTARAAALAGLDAEAESYFLKTASVQVKAMRNTDAITVLEEGTQRLPGSSALRNQLTRLRS